MSRRVESLRQQERRTSNSGPMWLIVGLLLGLLVGYLVPTLMRGSAAPGDLSPTAQRYWLRMTADSLSVTGRDADARALLSFFTPEQLSTLMGQEMETAQQEGDVARQQRLSQLAQAIPIDAQVPGGTGQPAPDGTTGASTSNNALAQLLMACGGALFLLLLLVGSALIMTRMRQAQPPRPRLDAARRRDEMDDTEVMEELPQLPMMDGSDEVEELDVHYEPVDERAEPVTAPPTPAPRVHDAPPAPALATGGHLPVLDSFNARYSYGDDDFDVQFVIEDAKGEFLGECGVGMGEVLNNGTPQQITAFELWLFDKEDIRTVTKILLSDYAWSNEPLRSAAADKGELVRARVGDTIDLETQTLRVRAHIREVEYGTGAANRNSYFERLSVELTPQQKRR